LCPFVRDRRSRARGVQTRGRRLFLPHSEGGVIRPARPQDVDGIAAVHASAWQAAYPGILPASVRQAVTVATRRKYWAGVRLDDSARDRPVFVAVEDNSVDGFAVCGPPRDRDMNFD